MRQRFAGIPGRLASPAGLAVLVLTGIAAVLRFALLTDQSIWYDESLTKLVVGGPLADVLDNVRRSESNPPLFYWAEWGSQWAWFHLHGLSDFSLRSFSALAGVLTVPVAYLAGRELASRRAGLILAALVATSPWLTWYSQEARSYSLLVLLLAASLYLFAMSRNRPSAWNLAGWGIASALAILTHYFAAALVAAEAGCLLVLLAEHRRAVAAATAVPLAAALAVLPLASDQHERSQWIGTLDLGGRIIETPKLFAVGNSYPAVVATLAVGAVVALAIAGLWMTRDQPARRGAGLVGAVAAVAVALVAMAVIAGEDFVIARNVIGLWLPLAAVVAIGLSLVRPAWLGTGAAVAVCLLYVGLTVNVARDWRLQRIDWKGAADLIGPTGTTRLLVARGGYQASPLPGYLEGTTGALDPALPLSEYAVLEYDDPNRGHLCWGGAACGMPPDDPSLPVPRGARLVHQANGDGFTARIYRLATPQALEDPGFRRLLPMLLRIPTATIFMQLPTGSP